MIENYVIVFRTLTHFPPSSWCFIGFRLAREDWGISKFFEKSKVSNFDSQSQLAKESKANLQTLQTLQLRVGNFVIGNQNFKVYLYTYLLTFADSQFSGMCCAGSGLRDASTMVIKRLFAPWGSPIYVIMMSKFSPGPFFSNQKFLFFSKLKFSNLRFLVFFCT